MAFCKRKESLGSVVQLLLVRSAELRKIVIKFVQRHFATYGKLRETCIVDLVLPCLNKATGTEALQLLTEIQAKNSENFNSDLNLSRFSSLDCDLILNNPKVRASIFLRYLPACLIRQFVNSEGLEVFLSEKVEWPNLLWSREMRRLLQSRLKEHFAGLRKTLREYAETEGYAKQRPVPLCAGRFKMVVSYPQIDREVRCGDYFLRAWNRATGTMEPSEVDNFFISLKQTFDKVMAGGKPNLEELEVVLKSFEIVFTRYSPAPNRG